MDEWYQTEKDIYRKYYENINRADSIQEALANLNNNYEDARILICGSLYLAGKVLEMN